MLKNIVNMAPATPVFTLPIEPSGSIICTQPVQNIYLLTFESLPDNRMTPAFCQAFRLALDIIDHKFPRGVVVTTSSVAKFYSNGLDYESAIKTEGFFEESLYPLWRRLLTYVDRLVPPASEMCTTRASFRSYLLTQVGCRSDILCRPWP